MRLLSRRTSAKSGGPHRRASEATAAVMEHFAYPDAVPAELVAGRVDVVHRQGRRSIDRARLSGGDPLAEDDRARRAGWCQLHHLEALAADVVDGLPNPNRL